MINRLLHLLKVGSPKVDLYLNAMELNAGEQVTGYFKLQGGWFKRKMSRLECDLIIEYRGKEAEFIEPVTTFLTSKVIDANEKVEIPLTYQFPTDLKPTSNEVSYRLRTKLVFVDDVKSMDHDEIIIVNKQSIKEECHAKMN